MSAPPRRIPHDRHSSIESSYCSYKSSRPNLFQQHGAQKQPMVRTSGPPFEYDLLTPIQANRTSVQIGVIADNQEHIVSLPNTLYDSSLTYSVIAKSNAFATQGQIRTSAPITLTDSHGHAFASSTTIMLRWRYDNGLQSFQEIFYIVDGCAGYDGMLRKDIETKPEDAHPLQAHPLSYHGHYGKQEKHDKEEKERDKQDQWKREMQADRERMRKHLEAAKKRK